tara:strand:+ start:4541 stop:5890 length:1350 start_codon:yes stop_codon:yes gene_type:complete
MNPKNFFYIGGIPTKFILNNILCFIIFFIFFYIFLKLSEKNKFLRNILKFLLVVEISYILKTIFPYKYLSILIFLVLIIFFSFVFIKFDFKKTLKFLGIALMPLFFLIIYNLFLLIFYLEPIKYNQFSSNKGNEIVNYDNKKKPVVWIIFDALSLEKIYKNKELKNFDKIMQVSDNYINYKVGIHDTAHSIPSIVLGKDVINFKTIYKNKKLSRIFFDKENKKISTDFNSSIFDQISKEGKSIYINGWYYPYCQMVKSYNKCFTNYYSWEKSSYKFGFLFMFNLYKLVPFRVFLLDKHFYSFNNYTFEFNEAIKSHKYSLKNFIDSLSKEFEFYYYHSSYPHHPYIFDSKKENYTEKYFDNSSYDENIIMTDLALGKIIKTLEKRNKFKDSLIIISSDHPLKDKDPSKNFKKPVLLIKNRNQFQGKIINQEVYNFQLKNIVLEKIFNSN